MLDNKFHEYDAILDSNQFRTPHANMSQFYKQVLGHLSHYALELLHNQWQELKNMSEPCTGLFRKSIGLSCAHEIQQMLADNQCLTLEDCHYH
jgi:hypothetical protein